MDILRENKTNSFYMPRTSNKPTPQLIKRANPLKFIANIFSSPQPQLNKEMEEGKLLYDLANGIHDTNEQQTSRLSLKGPLGLAMGVLFTVGGGFTALVYSVKNFYGEGNTNVQPGNFIQNSSTAATSTFDPGNIAYSAYAPPISNSYNGYPTTPQQRHKKRHIKDMPLTPAPASRQSQKASTASGQSEKATVTASVLVEEITRPSPFNDPTWYKEGIIESILPSLVNLTQGEPIVQIYNYSNKMEIPLKIGNEKTTYFVEHPYEITEKLDDIQQLEAIRACIRTGMFKARENVENARLILQNDNMIPDIKNLLASTFGSNDIQILNEIFIRTRNQVEKLSTALKKMQDKDDVNLQIVRIRLQKDKDNNPEIISELDSEALKFLSSTPKAIASRYDPQLRIAIIWDSLRSKSGVGLSGKPGEDSRLGNLPWVLLHEVSHVRDVGAFDIFYVRADEDPEKDYGLSSTKELLNKTLRDDNIGKERNFRAFVYKFLPQRILAQRILDGRSKIDTKGAVDDILNDPKMASNIILNNADTLASIVLKISQISSTAALTSVASTESPQV